MMDIRSIERGELVNFANAAARPNDVPEQMAYIEQLIEARAMRPDWCYVARRRRVALGRFAFWALPGIDHPQAIVLLDVADSRERTAIAAKLLARAKSDARERGSRKLGHVLDEPAQAPQFQHDPIARTGWLEAAGFRLMRSTTRWSYDGPPPRAGNRRLRYVSLDTAGDDEFVSAIVRVSTDSLDARTAEARLQLGADAEARETFADLQSLHYEARWWELAYAEGELIGLVMPVKTPTTASIGYVGVVPEKRGHRYVDDLLARGTQTLRRALPDLEIRADTDIANAPMAAAFRRARYTQFAVRREFECRLS